MNFELITAMSAAAACIVSFFALFLSARSYRNGRIARIDNARAQWESVARDWALLILYYYGDPDWYYSDASAQDREDFRGVIAGFDTGETKLLQSINFMRQETRRLRRIARFFSYISESILRGDLSVGDAYTIFGPDIARHRNVMLWVAGSNPVEPDVQFASKGSGWATLVDQMPESNFYDNQKLIIALSDLLEAERSKRGDTYAHLIFGNARVHAGGEGREARRRLHALSRSRGRILRGLFLAHALTYTQRVRWTAVVSADPDPIYADDDAQFLRAPWGFKWLMRRRFEKLRRL